MALIANPAQSVRAEGSAMPQTPEDRRDGPRVRISRAAKICQDGAARFVTAQTVNVSARGVLLEVEEPGGPARPLEVGQQTRLAIQWQNAALLRASGMIPGRIVRVEKTQEDRRRIAVRLDTSMAASFAPARPPLRAAA